MVGQMIESWTILRFPPPSAYEVGQPPFQSGGLDHSSLGGIREKKKERSCFAAPVSEDWGVKRERKRARSLITYEVGDKGFSFYLYKIYIYIYINIYNKREN
jgi:hypothetical protein